MRVELITFLLEVGGLYLIYRLFLRAWGWADIKEKEEALKDLAEKDKAVNNIRTNIKIEPGAEKNVKSFVKK